MNQPSDSLQQAMEILDHSDVLEELKKEVQKRIANEDIPIQILLLSVFSALLIKEPFGVLIYSASSAGKSYILDSILACLPAKFNALEVNPDGTIEVKNGFGYVALNDATLASITRAVKDNPRAFEGKLLILYELPEDASDETRKLYQAIRQYVSEGHYNRLITDDKTKQPILLRLEGYCACISLSAEQPIEIQWGNRFIFVNLDESVEQNRAIAEFQAMKYLDPYGQKEPNIDLFEDILLILQNEDEKIRCTRPPVWNPWVVDLVNIIQNEYGKDVRVRRYQDILFRAAEVIVRIQYRQREHKRTKDGLPLLLAEKWDNAKVLYLFDTMLSHTFKSITSGAVQLLRIIDNAFNGKEWTRSDLIQASGLGGTNVYNKMKMLSNYGLIEYVGKEGNAHVFRITEKGKNSNLSVHFRSMIDFLSLLPERTYGDDPVESLSSFTQELLVRAPPGQMNDIPNLAVNPSTTSISLEVFQRTIKIGINRFSQIREIIFQTIEKASERTIPESILRYTIIGRGFENEDAEKVIDYLVNQGELFVPREGQLSKP